MQSYSRALRYTTADPLSGAGRELVRDRRWDLQVLDPTAAGVSMWPTYNTAGARTHEVSGGWRAVPASWMQRPF